MAIRKHGNRWQVRVSIGGGARIEETLPPGASRADAEGLEATLRKRVIALRAGRNPDRTLDEALDRVETTAQTQKSWVKEKYRWSVLREHTAGFALEALPDAAEQFKRKALAAGLKPASINRYLAILRRAGNQAEKWGWTDLPLGKRVDLLPEQNARHVYLTPEQARSVLAEVHAINPVAGDLILLLLFSGLRRGEMLRLRQSNLVGEVIVLDAATKAGRPRAVPVPPHLMEVARRVVPANGKPDAMTAANLRRIWDLARKEAKFPGLRMHDLRHTYASWLVQSGSNLAAVRDLLGHSSLSVTSRYSHLAVDHLTASVGRLPEVARVSDGTKRAKKKPLKAA